MANGRPDWKWLSAVVIMGLGWAFSLGMWRFQVAANSEDITVHGKLNYHSGVRTLTDALDRRVQLVELGNARIEARLGEILRAIEKGR